MRAFGNIVSVPNDQRPFAAIQLHFYLDNANPDLMLQLQKSFLLVDRSSELHATFELLDGNDDLVRAIELISSTISDLMHAAPFSMQSPRLHIDIGVRTAVSRPHTETVLIPEAAIVQLAQLNASLRVSVLGQADQAIRGLRCMACGAHRTSRQILLCYGKAICASCVDELDRERHKASELIAKCEFCGDVGPAVGARGQTMCVRCLDVCISVVSELGAVTARAC